MKTYDTRTLLTDLYQRVEQVLQVAVTKWQMLPREELIFSTSPQQWSGAQCIVHLNSYGNYYLPVIEKTIARSMSSAQSHFKSSWLGNYFYTLMLPETKNNKFKKMRSPKDHEPSANINAAQAIAEFIDQCERLLMLIEKAEQINISKAKVPISIAKFIKLQLGDVFLFLIAHIERHVLQAEKMIQLSNTTKVATVIA